jgi:hypothetical protein
MNELGVQTMIRILVSRIGFNSICALIEKSGKEAVKPKLDLIRQVAFKNYNNKTKD